ncbi:MAG: hypothetical protein V1678_00020 [Candidatus Aenigmatarchaeota archaeon]
MEDLDEIKRIVSSRQPYEPIGTAPLPHEVMDLRKMMEETPKMAPIFVRVDKYKEVLSHIQELKDTVKNLESALAIRKTIHRMNADSDAVIERALQKFTESTSMFGREFVTPRGAEVMPKETGKEDIVDCTISQIRDEVTRLRSELERIKL